jgi:hypothetical protein
LKSTFQQDFDKEVLLGKYLDEIYAKKFEAPNYKIQRISDINQQYSGVDVILIRDNKEYIIDEKAQLSYLNKTLPTFVFELSYLKDESWREGWLFDKNKITEIYFLVTEIFCSDIHDLGKGFLSVKITAVNRNKLISYLSSKGLTKEVLMQYEKDIRQAGTAKTIIKELDNYLDGNLQYTNFLNEKPVNLVLKLDRLVINGIAKIIHDGSNI